MYPFFSFVAALALATAACSDDDTALVTTPTVTTIDPDYTGATFVNVMQPPADEQAELGDLLVAAMREEASLQPGFISAAVHRSLDNNYLLNYAKWADATDVTAFVERLQAGQAPKLGEVFSRTSPEFHPYRIVEQFRAQADAPVTFDDARWTMVNILIPDDTTSQAQLVDLLRTAMREEASRAPGFVSATVHASLDNDYVLNYAQWADKAALDAIVARVTAGELPALGTAFSRSSPEFHPYGNIEVVVAP